MSFTNPYPASRLTLDASNSLSSGLVGFWPLTDGTGSTAKDISTGANDFTLDSGTAVWESGSIGQSLAITADRFFSTSHSVNPDGADFTFSAWVKLNSSTSHYLVDFADSSKTSNDCLLWVSGTSLMFGERGDTDSGIHRNAQHTISATQDWFHVVGVRSGNSLRQLYFEGSYVAQSTNTIVNASTTYDRIGLGCLADSTPVNSGDFQIQNVRIYNRALSATEVATLFNRPWESTNYGDLWPYSPPAPADATLSTDTAATALMTDCVLWYPLTDGSGSSAADMVGSNTGTLGANAGWDTGSSLGAALSLDGTSTSSVTTSSVTTNTQPISHSIWFKTSGDGYIVDSLGASDRNVIWIASGQLFAYGGTSSISLGSLNQYTDGEWHNVVVVFNGASSAFYVDGVLKSSLNSGSSGWSGTTLGSKYDGTSLLTGKLQNYRVWERALSADDVAVLFERPFEGLTYGDAFHYDPPTPANLTPLDNSSGINTGQELWLPLTDGTGTTAVDISGGGNDGTLTGTSSNIPTWHVGRLGSSVEGDGTNARRVEVSNTALSTVSAMSVSCWIFNDAVNNYEVYFSYGQLNYLFALQRVATQDILRFYTVGLTGNTDLRTPAGALKTGVWQNVVCTYDGSTKKIYFDGVEVASASSTGSITQPTSNTAILSAAGSGFDVDGKMTNVRIWSRALSEAEVWSIYENPWLGSAYSDAAAVIYNYILRSKRFRRL